MIPTKILGLLGAHVCRLLFLFSVTIGPVSKASAQWSTADTSCAPQYTGVPFTYMPPAVNSTFVTTFDGSVDNDTGWTGAFRYVLSYGTGNDGAFQIIQDQTKNHLYLSFQMKNDPTFDKYSSIIVAFDPGTGPQNMQRLIIYPLVGNGVGATSPIGALPAGSVHYWKGYTPPQGGPGTGSWGTLQTDPSLVTAAVAQSSTNGTENSWDVEVELDDSIATGLGLPAAPAKFGLYVNMVRIDSSTSPNTDTQFTWPANSPLAITIPAGEEFVLEGDSLPPTANWGTGSLATSCSGVNISTSDITDNHSGVISLNQGNQFSVLVHNSGAQAANQVFATFQISNYGLPSPLDWARPGDAYNNLIPNDPLPTDTSPPTVSVGASGGTATLSTGSWTPGSNTNASSSNPTQTEEQYYQATPDTCIQVTLNSLASDTIFSVRSTWQNFQTGMTSEFKHTAAVSTKGYPLPPGATNHEFNLDVSHDYTPAAAEPGVISRYPNLRYSKFQEIVHGCRITGKHLVIGEKKFDDCEEVGSFGYNLTHEGPVDGFLDSLEGEGLVKNTENGSGYHLVVAPGATAMLTTTVVSQVAGGGATPPSTYWLIFLLILFIIWVLWRLPKLI